MTTTIKWVLTIAAALVLAAIALVPTNGESTQGEPQQSYADGPIEVKIITAESRLCSGGRPIRCTVRYKPEGENTRVLMDCQCSFGFETWHISGFEGDQPDLWKWWEIQNTASMLLRCD